MFLLSHSSYRPGIRLYLSLLSCYSIWFWVQERTDDHSSAFNLSRDSVYGAIILLGVGGAIVLAIAMAMFSYLIGDYLVRST